MLVFVIKEENDRPASVKDVCNECPHKPDGKCKEGHYLICEWMDAGGPERKDVKVSVAGPLKWPL